MKKIKIHLFASALFCSIFPPDTQSMETLENIFVDRIDHYHIVNASGLRSFGQTRYKRSSGKSVKFYYDENPFFPYKIEISFRTYGLFSKYEDYYSYTIFLNECEGLDAIKSFRCGISSSVELVTKTRELGSRRYTDVKKLKINLPQALTFSYDEELKLFVMAISPGLEANAHSSFSLISTNKE